jgi:hypothetical protein
MPLFFVFWWKPEFLAFSACNNSSESEQTNKSTTNASLATPSFPGREGECALKDLPAVTTKPADEKKRTSEGALF